MTDSRTGPPSHQETQETLQAKNPLYQKFFSQLKTDYRHLINQGWSVDGILESLGGTVPEIATMLEAFKKQLEEQEVRLKKELDARMQEQKARL